MENKDEQIEKILKLTEETHRMMKSMKRSQNAASLMKLIYISIFIYASWWSYKEFMPYMDQVKSLVAQVKEMSQNTEIVTNKLSPEVINLLDKLPK